MSYKNKRRDKLIVAPKSKKELENLSKEELIKKRQKLMKEIIKLEKEYFISENEINEIQDPSPDIMWNYLNEELINISEILEEKNKCTLNKDIYI